MAFKQVRNDLLPFKAGIVRLIPLDSEMRPIWKDAISTAREFLVSTQVTETSSEETVANGNGQDLSRKQDTVYNLAVSTNVYDPKFHAALSGSTLSSTGAKIPYDTSFTLVAGQDTGSIATYTFPNDQYKPVKNDGENAIISVVDTFGNRFTQVEKASAELAEDEFTYDPDTFKLVFNEAYVDATLSCSYYIDAAEGETYDAPSTPVTKVFRIEVFGELQSASSGEPTGYSCVITRGSISGDLPNVTTQKPLTNTATYNFKSMPTPKGVTPFQQTFLPLKEAQVVGG